MNRLVVMLMFFCQVVAAQDNPLTLNRCQEVAHENYPLQKGNSILQSQLDVKLENLRVTWLPQLWLNTKVSWQSDVPGMSMPGMNLPKAPKDQYAMNVDMEQLIYDGGRNKQLSRVERANIEAEQQSIEVQLYKLKERVNKAYFTVLLMRHSKRVVQEKHKTLSQRLKEVSSAVKNGVVLASNEKVLQAELLIVEQQTQELEAGELASLDILSVLMGKSLASDVELEVPEIVLVMENAQKRPEYQLFQNQMDLIGAQQELVKKDRLPIISGFGQVGYGNPGMKFLADEFDSYYMVGARLRWNIFDWKKSRRQTKILTLQQKMVRTNLDTFSTNLNSGMKARLRDIVKYQNLLDRDGDIVSLRRDITHSAASQLSNGVITSSSYLDELEKEVQAKLSQQYHKILLLQSKADYNRIAGNCH